MTASPRPVACTASPVGALDAQLRKL